MRGQIEIWLSRHSVNNLSLMQIQFRVIIICIYFIISVMIKKISIMQRKNTNKTGTNIKVISNKAEMRSARKEMSKPRNKQKTVQKGAT